jgi:uncharacterized protein (TIGR00369 family)
MNDAVALFRAKQAGYLPDHLALDWAELGKGFARGWFEIGKQHLAPNGYLHAAAVVALADTACGYGCFMSLPEGAAGFTTVELKTNFIGTALEGRITCEARLIHGGRTTQVWDAEVKSEATGKTIALFRCTQADASLQAARRSIDRSKRAWRRDHQIKHRRGAAMELAPGERVIMGFPGLLFGRLEPCPRSARVLALLQSLSQRFFRHRRRRKRLA